MSLFGDLAGGVMGSTLGGLFGGGGGGIPNPPDPNQVAQAQLKYGQQVQGMNAVPQSGVFGQTSYKYDPATGRLLGAQTGLNATGQQISNALMGELGTSPTSVSDAVYKQYASRLDPQWQQSQTALNDQLANQGIGLGTDAYKQAMDQFGRQRTDAYQTASREAQLAGGQEQSRILQGLFGLGNEATAGYQAIPQIATPNFGQYAYDTYGGQQDVYNAKQGGMNNLLGGLFGLGAASILGPAGAAAAPFVSNLLSSGGNEASVQTPSFHF